MSATDELRRMLDERGMEWTAVHDSCTCWFMPVGDQMHGGFRVPVRYDDTLHIECVMSPTQAIAATLDCSDAVAFCKRVEKAVNNREPLELFGVQYEPVGNEPFCETVERWLNGDAPKECRECTEGKYAELSAMTLGCVDKGIPQGDGGNLDQSQVDWLRLMPDGWDGTPPTLGCGECEIETTENRLPAERYHRCKFCGAFFAVLDASGDIPPCVCPNCGRKIRKAVKR